MKQSTTAKMTGFTPGYVSHVAAGRKHNDKIKQLLEVPEQDFIAYFFLNPAMLNICDAAIRNCRKTADKKLAVELSTAVNHFQSQKPACPRSAGEVRSQKKSMQVGK